VPIALEHLSAATGHEDDAEKEKGRLSEYHAAKVVVADHLAGWLTVISGMGRVRGTFAALKGHGNEKI
jgi:hypothetical protein